MADRTGEDFEEVAVKDLKVGDVVSGLGEVKFIDPFTTRTRTVRFDKTMRRWHEEMKVELRQ